MSGAVWWMLAVLAVAILAGVGVASVFGRRSAEREQVADTARAARIRTADGVERNAAAPAGLGDDAGGGTGWPDYVEPDMGGKSDRLAETSRAARRRRHDAGTRAQRREREDSTGTDDGTAAAAAAAGGMASYDLFADPYGDTADTADTGGTDRDDSAGGASGDWGTAAATPDPAPSYDPPSTGGGSDSGGYSGGYSGGSDSGGYSGGGDSGGGGSW